MNETISALLLAWYDQNARTLPWRGIHDPYRTWVSETMLQQTRVETVRGYYERFLARFPDVAALAAAGRILFGPIPDFKPVSAIAIIAGATLGRRNGFMVGTLAALTSNFFFGQGMWTPWQMYAWGLVGYVGGALAHAGAFDRADGTVRMPALMAYGFASGLLYGVVINAYDIIGFVQPLTWAGAVARLATAVPFDITHGLATCVFLAALYKPWCRRITRVVVKYGL